MTADRSRKTGSRSKRSGPSSDGEILLERFPEPARRATRIYTGYPASYSIAMSNLGFHFLYGAAARTGRFRIERFFNDTAPYTLESGSRISSARALLFSVSYEEDYINLVRMLVKSGIEPRREKRDGRPLVIVGGPAVSSNPFPLADIMDLAVLGEGERSIVVLLDLLDGMDDGDPGEFLSRAAREEGFFVPASASTPMTSTQTGVETDSFPHSVILTGDTAFPWTMLLETGRGCPGGCAFCLATSLYRPFRPLSIERLKSKIEGALSRPERVGLISTAVTSHPDFTQMMKYLRENKIKVGLSSINAAGLDEEKVSEIAGAGIRSVSLAPETGDERLRMRIGKKVTDDTFVNAAGLLSAGGIDRLSLYFMTGMPGEDDTIHESTRAFLERMAGAGKSMRISVHLNVMIPKPWTPMQFAAMPPENKLRERISSISEASSSAGLRFQVKSLRNSIRQARLSLGGIETGQALIDFAEGRVSWKKAINACSGGVDSVHTERGIESPPPWYGIKGPSDHEVLLARYAKVKG